MKQAYTSPALDSYSSLSTMASVVSTVGVIVLAANVLGGLIAGINIGGGTGVMIALVGAVSGVVGGLIVSATGAVLRAVRDIAQSTARAAHAAEFIAKQSVVERAAPALQTPREPEQVLA